MGFIQMGQTKVLELWEGGEDLLLERGRLGRAGGVDAGQGAEGRVAGAEQFQGESGRCGAGDGEV